MTAKYIDRSQLRVVFPFFYYDDLAKTIGCYPSVPKLLMERPTALWHSWMTMWQPLHWRMVGPGRLENAEEKIEALYHSRYYGTYLSKSNPLYGTPKPGISLYKQWQQRLLAYTFLAVSIPVAWLQGFDLGSRVEDHLRQNLKRAEEDMARDPVMLHHSLAMHEVPHDGFQDRGGTVAFAFANRRQAAQTEMAAAEGVEVPTTPLTTDGAARERL
jgi:hypothetical protein